MKKLILIIAIVSLIVLVGCKKQEPQIANPASVHCKDSGYDLEMRETDAGTVGYCIVDGLECEEWTFFRGECSFCQQYCENQTHIQCVGSWNISGEYPDCNCQFICTTTSIS